MSSVYTFSNFHFLGWKSYVQYALGENIHELDGVELLADHLINANKIARELEREKEMLQPWPAMKQEARDIQIRREKFSKKKGNRGPGFKDYSGVPGKLKALGGAGVCQEYHENFIPISNLNRRSWANITTRFLYIKCQTILFFHLSSCNCRFFQFWEPNIILKIPLNLKLELYTLFSHIFSLHL